jgi:hypothetical protein
MRKVWGVCKMKNSNVKSFLAVSFILAMLFIAGKFEAMDQCAEFQANNDYQNALDAGCSFDVLPNGEYPYTWEASE